MEHLRNQSLKVFVQSVEHIPDEHKVVVVKAYISSLLTYIRAIDGHIRGKTVYSSHYKQYGFSCDCGDYKPYMKGGNEMIERLRSELDIEIKYLQKRFFSDDEGENK